MNVDTFNKLSCGLFIVASKMDKKFNGQISNTVLQVTGDPPEIISSINRKNLTYSYIQASRVFTATILSTQTPLTFIGTFGFKSGRDIDKFKGVDYKVGITGAPIVLDHGVGYFEAKVIGSLDCGPHTIFLGRVLDAQMIKENAEPMTYEFYHLVKQGYTPETAASYIKKEEVESVSKKAPAPAPKPGKPAAQAKMSKYKCSVCGYVYDPEKGDPDSGIKPGVPFESLPDDWVCPVCGASKDQFEKIED
jgi:rubredoxin/flavin reductase (DIM6/NTAB) family NADH-FMN oxidoreductase RutF